MRTASVVARGVSYADYLHLEATGDAKHEWLDGVVYAMAPRALEHSALAASVIASLTVALRGNPCRVLTSGARVRVRATGLATYADVSVACGRIEHDPDDADALANPLVLVALCAGTMDGLDQHLRLAHYRHIPSLRDHLLMGEHGPMLEHHFRNADGTWAARTYGPGAALRLTGIDARFVVPAPPGVSDSPQSSSDRFAELFVGVAGDEDDDEVRDLDEKLR